MLQNPKGVAAASNKVIEIQNTPDWSEQTFPQTFINRRAITKDLSSNLERYPLFSIKLRQIRQTSSGAIASERIFTS